ncbi:MAG: GTPase Era [Oscillospiraceae bacterium]|nr:GTPase Era [Oscillospiraceae bacterium]
MKNVFISITGRANSGKSSLLNSLVGEKIAIVSDKPQTTRKGIRGIITLGEPPTQYVFVDTPGFHRARNRLSEHMVKSVRAENSGVDVALFVADVTKKVSPVERELAQSLSCPCILLLNKTDLFKDKTAILKAIDDYKGLYEFDEIIPLSVKNSDNLELILPLVEKYASEAESLFFPRDVLTDQGEAFRVCEIVREKLLHILHEEIPHGIAVEVESMRHSKTNKGKKIIDLSLVIICEKASHKGIIIGKQGSALKKSGTLARCELEDYFGCKVNMSLWVKVKDDWRNKEAMLVQLGLSGE